VSSHAIQRAHTSERSFLQKLTARDHGSPASSLWPSAERTGRSVAWHRRLNGKRLSCP
jgi:hypothetical protein